MKTTIYQLTIPVEGNREARFAALDEYVPLLDQEPDAERSGTWSDEGLIRLFYRTVNDDVAIAIARMIAGDKPGAQIHTGLGVHRRLVKSF